MQLRRIGTHRGIEYIVRLTDCGLRYDIIDAKGLTAVREEVCAIMPCERYIKQRLDFYLDECELEWE